MYFIIYTNPFIKTKIVKRQKKENGANFHLNTEESKKIINDSFFELSISQKPLDDSYDLLMNHLYTSTFQEVLRRK